MYNVKLIHSAVAAVTLLRMFECSASLRANLLYFLIKKLIIYFFVYLFTNFYKQNKSNGFELGRWRKRGRQLPVFVDNESIEYGRIVYTHTCCLADDLVIMQD